MDVASLPKYFNKGNIGSPYLLNPSKLLSPDVNKFFGTGAVDSMFNRLLGKVFPNLPMNPAFVRQHGIQDAMQLGEMFNNGKMNVNLGNLERGKPVVTNSAMWGMEDWTNSDKLKNISKTIQDASQANFDAFEEAYYRMSKNSSEKPDFLAIYKVSRDILHGGKADGEPDNKYNKEEMALGIKDELAHTKNLQIRKEITKDHLEEDPHFYTKQEKKAENEQKKSKKRRSREKNEKSDEKNKKNSLTLPALGAAGALGTSIGLSRNKKLMEALKYKLNPNYNNSLFGEDVARRAREKGLIYLNPDFEKIDKSFIRRNAKKLQKSKLFRSLGNKLMEGQIVPGDLGSAHVKSLLDRGGFLYNTEPNTARQIEKAVGGRFKATSDRTNTITNQSQKLLNMVGENKYLESRYFKDIPKTDRVSTIKRRLKSRQKLVDKLNEMHPDGWVAKKINAGNTLRSRESRNPKIFFSGDANAKLFNRAGLRSPKQWIVQPNEHLKKINPIIDKLEKLIMPDLHRSHSQMKEYRVHAVNGKVIPYASVHRGSGFLGKLEALLPFRTSGIRKAEGAAQAALDKIKNRQLRKGHFGFDIAFNRHNRPIIIETNPSGRTGTSGFTIDPFVSDATRAAIKGKLPGYVKMRRGLWGGLGLAGLGMGAYGLKNLVNNRKTINKPEVAPNLDEGIPKVAMTFGATRNLLKYLKSQGVPVARSPRQALKTLPDAPQRLPKIIPENIRHDYGVDSYGAMLPYGTNRSPKSTIYIPRKQHLNEKLKNESVSPRSTLFHEAGHYDHYIEDPKSLGGYYANPRGKYGVRGKYNANAKMLMLERIADRNALQRMKTDNVPTHLQNLYLDEAKSNYDEYLKYIGNGLKRKYLDKHHPELLTKTNPVENLD